MPRRERGVGPISIRYLRKSAPSAVSLFQAAAESPSYRVGIADAPMEGLYCRRPYRVLYIEEAVALSIQAEKQSNTEL